MKFLKRVIGGVLSAFMLVGSVAPALAASDIVTTTSSGYQYLSGVSSKLGYHSQTKAITRDFLHIVWNSTRT